MPFVLPLLLMSSTEELTFSPDRPGFADSTDTVPEGHFDIELGVRTSIEDDATLLNLPSLLVRVGLTSFLEARVIAPDLQLDLPRDSGKTQAGAGDMGFGLKLALSLGDIFSASGVPFITVPSGSKSLSSGAVDGGFELNVQLAFGDFSVGANAIAGAITLEGRPKRAFDLGAGISFGYGFTDAFGAFVEAYIQYTDGETVQPSVAGGLTYLVSPTVQIDLSGGAGVTSEAEGPYVIAGIATLL